MLLLAQIPARNIFRSLLGTILLLKYLSYGTSLNILNE